MQTKQISQLQKSAGVAYALHIYINLLFCPHSWATCTFSGKKVWFGVQFNQLKNCVTIQSKITFRCSDLLYFNGNENIFISSSESLESKIFSICNIFLGHLRWPRVALQSNLVHRDKNKHNVDNVKNFENKNINLTDIQSCMNFTSLHDFISTFN